jgi:hypothetical protein
MGEANRRKKLDPVFGKPNSEKDWWRFRHRKGIEQEHFEDAVLARLTDQDRDEAWRKWDETKAAWGDIPVIGWREIDRPGETENPWLFGNMPMLMERIASFSPPQKVEEVAAFVEMANGLGEHLKEIRKFPPTLVTWYEGSETQFLMNLFCPRTETANDEIEVGAEKTV